MTLTFPLPLEAFFADLPIAAGSPDLGEALEMAETGYGEILTAANGNRLWKLDIEIASRDYREGARIQALLDVLRYPGRSLIARATPIVGPFNDPGGLIAAGHSITVKNIDANNRVVQLTGFPLNYKFIAGDYISFQYGSNPVRYAMHRVVDGGNPANSNTDVLLEVTPFIQPGLTVGTVVEVIKPVFKAVVVPGSTKSGKVGQQRVEGISFSLIQTFR